MKDKILEISKKEGLIHIGSCLTALPIIQEIYNTKLPKDKFVLSQGHAHLAHALVMGREDMPAGIHCDKSNGCDVGTGSLGQGLPIALGMAIADREVDVYCLISDGECAEGSVWEALRVKSDLQVTNLHIYVNSNGFGGYGEINQDVLEERLRMFCPDIEFRKTRIDSNTLGTYPQLEGLGGHYEKI